MYEAHVLNQGAKKLACKDHHEWGVPTACDRLRPPATACDCLRKFSYMSTDGITHTLASPLPPARPASLPPSLQVCNALTH